MANIDLTTPELIEYNKAVEFNAKRKNNFMFNNKGSEMALIVFRSIFRNATKNIKIVAKNLDNEVTNHIEYITALESFLGQSNCKLDILVSEHTQQNDTSDLFKMLDNYKEKISVKTISNGRTFKDAKGRIIHFCIADGHMYRLEYDIKNRMAECNFNDVKEYALLDGLFNSVFNNSMYSQDIPNND